MKRCLIAILLFSLMLLLCACMLIPMHTEIPSQTAAESAKPAAPTPTPAPAYEVTMQRATTWVSGTGSRWVQVIAAIENTGSASLCLSGGAYDLEDAPGETGYLCETALLDEPVDGELTLLARPDVEKARVDLVRFAATDIDLAMDQYGDLRIKGRVQNTSDEIYIQTKIVALLFDADGNLLGLD